VTVVLRLDDAIERAVALAEADVVGSPGVLITGSVIAIGEARTLLVRDEPVVVAATRENLDNEWDADYSEDGHETDRDWR
jgi:dihydrofolate synthase / folylpolyglutamate synthase